MSLVKVTLGEFFAAPGNVLVTVTSVLVNSLNVISGNTGILPGAESERTDGFGVAEFTMRPGRYRVEAVSSKALATGLKYSVLIDVPDDNLTYFHTELIVDGATLFDPALGAGSPLATDTVYGLVTLDQIEAMIAAGGGGSSSLAKDTVAALRLVTSVASGLAKACFVWGNAAAGDGLGGIYRWDAAGAEADDGMGVIRPSDFAAAGVWKKFI